MSVRSILFKFVFLAACMPGLLGCTLPSVEVASGLPTAIPLASPVADSPAAGICADSPDSAVTVLLMPDMPTPRCARVLPDQHLQVINQSSAAWKIALGPFTATLGPGETYTLETKFRDFLAPGVHRLTVSAIPPSNSALPGSVEIWLVPALPPSAPNEPPPTTGQDADQLAPTTPGAPASASPTLPPQTMVTPAVPILDQPGEIYQTLFSIPVGADGVEYFGAGVPEMQISGPNAIAIPDENTFAIADPIANRIRLYDFSGNLVDTIHLLKLNIHMILDLLAVQDTLLVMEVGFGPMPETNHIYRLSRSGALVSSYTLPPWASMENGLVGMQAGELGEIYLLMRGGEELYQVLDDRGAFLPTRAEGFTHLGQVYWASGLVGKAGEVSFKTEFSHDLGGLRVLGILPDGSFFIVREDVVNDQVIQVDQTVHYLSPSGEQLGVARVPIGESYYPVTRPLVLGPDGNVYALLPRPNGVDILRLNFFKQLDPLLPGAVRPWVGPVELPSQ